MKDCLASCPCLSFWAVSLVRMPTLALLMFRFIAPTPSSRFIIS